MESWSGGEGRVFSTEDTGAPSWEDCSDSQIRCEALWTSANQDASATLGSSLDSVKETQFSNVPTDAFNVMVPAGTKEDVIRPKLFPFQLVLTLTQRKPPLLQDALLLFMIKLTATRHQNNKFLRYLSWNGSGMSSHKLDEVKQWCLGQRIQVLILTETRWQFSNEWA